MNFESPAEKDLKDLEAMEEGSVAEPEIPEFDPERIDVERLRGAIVSALESEESDVDGAE